MNIGEIYNKYCNGDNISDEELNFGISHFEVLQDYLIELGEKFHLQRKEISRVLYGLEDFKKARKNK